MTPVLQPEDHLEFSQAPDHSTMLLNNHLSQGTNIQTDNDSISPIEKNSIITIAFVATTKAAVPRE